MKKILSVVLTVMLVLSVLPMAAFGADAVELGVEGCFEYTISDGEVTITGCEDSSAGDVIIPSEIEGCPVTKIGKWAFSSNDIKSISIPSSVKVIDDMAFAYCYDIEAVYTPSLEAWCNIEFVSHDSNPLYFARTRNLYVNGELACDISIPESVTEIKPFTFNSCYSLTSVKLHNGIMGIGNNAFASCKNLDSITMPDSIEYIGDSAFSRCENLRSVIIGNGVKTVGNSAFKECKSITYLVIPNGAEGIGDNAFSECEGLKSIVIPKSVTKIGNDAFSKGVLIYTYKNSNAAEYAASKGCEIVYLDGGDEESIFSGSADGLDWSLDKRTGELSLSGLDYIPGCYYGYSHWKDYKQYITSVKFLENFTSIGLYAFYGLDCLRTLEIPDSITAINSNAFMECTSLSELVFGEGLTDIGYMAFDSCENITSVRIPDSVKNIANDAFSGCSRLENITIGNSVETIGDSAFHNCKSLKEITIPNSVTTIGEKAFRYCENLKIVTIGNNLKSIGNDAFSDCDNIEKVEAFDIESWCNIDFGSIHSNPTCWSGDLYINGTLVKDLVIPAGITKINDNAFRNCKSITSVEVPYSVRSIGRDAFEGCENLESVKIHKNLVRVYEFAFFECKGLKEVWYSGSVSDKEKLVFEQFNDNLLNANWNYTQVECAHTYDYACDDTCNLCGEVREAAAHRYNIYQKTDDEHWLVCVCGKRELEYNFGHGYSRVCDSEYHWLECECGAITDKGKHSYDDKTDRVCNYCFMANTKDPLLEKEADGKYYYYVNGYRENVTELVKIDGVWYYIKNGVWDTSIDTLHKINGKWFLVKGGIWNKTTGLVEYKGKTFYVKGGKWDSSINELKKLNGKWYFIKSGKWDKTLDSLHKLNGKWFLVKKGMWTATTGLVEYKGKMFYVKGGKWESRNEIVKLNGKNYYIKGGKWDKKLTTLFKKSGKYYAIKNGMWYKSKAIIKYSGKKYYVNKGYAQTSFSGKVTISGKKYTVKKGIVK